MTPTVLLLLSIVYTVRGSCNVWDKHTVRNLQGTIRHENSIGFLTVFPKNYFVPRFNNSTQCQDQTATCCVFSEAVLLSHSWAQLLQHLDRSHFKYGFITELKIKLDDISKEGFQETPDPSVFPSINSTPGTLLTFTSSLLSKWLELNCPSGENVCAFTIPSTSEEDEEEEGEQGIPDKGTGTEVEGNVESEIMCEDLPHEKEGEREKRWITVIPTNGDSGLSTSPGLVLCALYLLCGW